jgi:hypothetical protein
MSVALFEGFQASLICFYGKTNMWMKMSVGRWWNDTDRVNNMWMILTGENNMWMILTG